VDAAPDVAGSAEVTPSAGVEIIAPVAHTYHRVAKCRWCGGRFVKIHNAIWRCESEACFARCEAHAIRYTAVADDASPYFFLPLPLNVDLLESPWKRTLIAGAAGSSKSFGARRAAYAICRMRPGIRVLLLRCTNDELVKNHLQFMPMESVELGRCDITAKYSAGNPKKLECENGAVIATGYCDDAADIPRHLGAEWDLIIIEEAVNLLPRAISEISARDRGSFTVTHDGERDGKTWLLSNPGGRAMLYLSDTYITKAPDPLEYPAYDANVHGYIHATLDDNPYLPVNYAEKNLSGLTAARYQQLRHGDWTVFAGQFFSEWHAAHIENLDAHVA
jgi:hypothetical protein